MAHVVFTQQLRRFIETPELDVDAASLRDALDAVFAVHPRLRGYVLDEQGHLRPNVVAFVDGVRSADRVALADALRRVTAAGIALDGASDHGVSEALYLRDPDQNGVELYRDRAEAEWPRDAGGALQMFTRRLDLDDLLSEPPLAG